MIEQISKYLPIIGLLGLIWGIIQFYQKRSYINSDLKKEEKRSSFIEVDFLINDIKNEYLKLFAVISQTALTLGKKVNFSKQEKSLNEHKINFENFKLDLAAELENANDILEIIEKDGFDEKKYKTILEKQLELAEKRQNKLVDFLEKSKKNLDELKLKENKLSNLFDDNNIKLFDKVKKTSSTLQELILKLNKISLIGIDDKYLLKSLIFNLTNSVQKLINQLEAEDEINRINILEVINMENIKETMKIIYEIENHLYNT